MENSAFYTDSVAPLRSQISFQTSAGSCMTNISLYVVFGTDFSSCFQHHLSKPDQQT
jgi:hypothetical protein